MGGGKDIKEEFDKGFRLKLDRILPKQSIVGKVVSIDKGNLTCDVEPADGGATYHNVRLQSIIDDSDQGLVCIPKLGSFVSISILMNDENNAFVSQYSELESFWTKIDEMEFQGDKDGILIKCDGQNLRDVLLDFMGECKKIVVVNGTTINQVAVTAIEERFKKVLKEG